MYEVTGLYILLTVARVAITARSFTGDDMITGRSRGTVVT